MVMKYCADCVVVQLSGRPPDPQKSNLWCPAPLHTTYGWNWSVVSLSSQLSRCQIRYTVFIRFPTYKSQQKKKCVRQTIAEADFWFQIEPESDHCTLWKWKRNIEISDRFVEAQMNIFRFSFSISLQNIKEKGQFCQIFQKRNWFTDNCEAQCSTLKLKFHLEDGPLQQPYFDFFPGMVYIFTPQKIVAVILVNFFAPKSFIFSFGKYGT